jgi:hypothetical protein
VGALLGEGLNGLEDLRRCGTPPIYGEGTDNRIRSVLDQPPPPGFARWNGPLIAKALGDVDVQYVWRSLRKQKIDLGGRKSWCESNDAHRCLHRYLQPFVWTKSKVHQRRLKGRRLGNL